MSTENTDQINEAFKVIDNAIYEAVARKAMTGDLQSVKTLQVLKAEMRTTERLELRKELFGV